MSYQVIARKYRPQRFQDVVGQEHVTQTLANAIASGRIAHAYLFCGPRGTGKTTVARIFAKALNCTGGPRADFDEEDPRCREITEGRSLDVLEIDGASNNGVEQVRELRDTARFAPASSKFKIYIIDEVHMLSTAAFNALLKTLEEPPAHVKFLFATTDPEKVLPTILSRCQRFDLRRIPSSLIVGHLASIATAEGVVIDEAALQAIARGADGGMRDAESTLDQLISFCGERIEEADVLSMFGLAARAQVLALVRALLQGDAQAALREFNGLARGGKDLGRLLQDVLHHFRNLLVLQVSGGDTGLLEVSESEAEQLRADLDLAPVETVTRMLEVLTAGEGRLRDAVARKIFLEVLLMKVIQARHSVSLDAVMRQLHQWRGEGGGGGRGGEVGAPGAGSTGSASGPVAAAPPASPPEAGGPRPTSIPRPAAPTAGMAPAVVSDPPAGSPQPETDAAALWARVVAVASLLTRAALQVGQAVGLDKNTLTVAYPDGQESQLLLVDTERTRRAIETRLAEFAGRPLTLKFVRGGVAPVSLPVSPPTAGDARAGSGGAGKGTAPPAAAAGVSRGRPEKPVPVVPLKLDPTEFKNDPLIREAIELFKGQLVEVRRAEETGGEPGGVPGS